MREEDMLELLKNDPERGMKKLIQLYGGLVYSIVRGKLLPPEFGKPDIEDCVSDTFAELWKVFSCPGAYSGSVKGLVSVIAKRNAIDVLRKRYRSREELTIDSDEAPPIADEISLEGSYEESELKESLIRAVKTLGEPDREIIVRKFFLSQTSKEIAKQLRLSVSNVDTRTHRAVARLKKIMKGEI